jgi:FMN phosphatase YigB (HAD superfamily)
VFFDDGAHNVAAARRVGMHAYQVHSPDELMTVVQCLEAASPV